MKILVINGPNLNMLGKRNKAYYGDKTLPQIDALLKKEGKSLGADVVSFQSNSEGELIDCIQKNSSQAAGIIINPGALTHYGLSLRDALVDSGLPVVEVHLSNIYAREEWRAKSVIASISRGQISGFGWRSYIAALQILVDELKVEK
jgi:3-dehydroquinate dehydratase-2